MMVEAVHVRITTYLEKKTGIIGIVEDHLFGTLGKIEEFCADNGVLWCLQPDGKSRKTASKDQALPEKFEWYFMASEKTYEIIAEMFDKFEDMNLVTFFIEAC